MNSFFAFIYDTIFGIYDQNFDLIHTHLFDSYGYTKMGIVFFALPLVGWFFFYFLWKYPYGKILHWLIWLLILAITTMGFTYGIANSEIFASNNQELNDALANSSFTDYAVSLPYTYALINGLLAAIVSFLYSIFLKQFSKINIHLPF